MMNYFKHLDLFNRIKDTAKDPKTLCGAIMGLLWIIVFISYSIFSIVTYDVSTPIVSIQDLDVTRMPGNFSLDSMNLSISLVCTSLSRSKSANPNCYDCASTPTFYNFSYNNLVSSLNNFSSFPTEFPPRGGCTANNYSYPMTISLSQLDPSLTFAALNIISEDSDSSINAIYIQVTLTHLQINYASGSVNYISTVYYEQMDVYWKEYHYVFQVKDYYINSKSQFSTDQTYYREVSMNKVFYSYGSTYGVTIKFMVNALGQSTNISYKKYLDLLSRLGGFWTSILGILAMVYFGYWKLLHPLLCKCKKAEVQDTTEIDKPLKAEVTEVL